MSPKFLCLFLALQVSSGKKIFEFDKTPRVSNSGFSAATLVNNEQLPQKFVVCSSHFQKEVNTPSTHTIYVIYEDEEFVSPWFNIGIWKGNFLWANIENRYWYNLGKLSKAEFADWIHICLNIDNEKQEIETSVNGRTHNKTQIRKFEKVPKFNLRIGVVLHSDISIPIQFFGRVSNIQILRYDDETQLSALTKDLCKNREELNILSWSNMKWNIHGETVNFLDTDSSYVCSNSSYIDLYVPFQVTKSRGKEVCSKLGKGEISTLKHPIHMKRCVDFWTPYLFTHEKKTVNEYRNEPVSLKWCDGMPYNNSNFDQVVYDNQKGCYKNKYSVALYEHCTICNSSVGAIYKMRGNCKSSILG